MDGFDETLEIEVGDGFDVNKEYIMKDLDATEKGISVVVDVSGPLESRKLENPRSKILEYESSIIGRMLNGTLNRGDKTASSVMHVEFSSGNLVWVKGISSTWWPGLIFNPSDSSTDIAASNSEFSNALLVKYFGNNRMVWCDPSQLKLFVENFDEMSKMNNSKMFLYSVDKAVIELNRRLGLDMGCSCKSQQGKGIVTSSHDVISNFQPDLFLPFLKCLARDGFMPGFLEVTSVKNLLTSFYRSKVHSGTSGENLMAVSAEPGQESREKRKSKYLSSPYTNKNKSVSEEPSSKSSTKGGGKKSNKKQNSSVLARDYMNKPPLEILSNLLKAAVTGQFVSDKGYFSEFRKWAFCDKSIFDLQVMKTLHGSNDGQVKVKKETEIVNGGGEEDTPIITFMRKKPKKQTAIPDLPGSLEKDIQEGSSNKKKLMETSCPLPDISANETATNTDAGKEEEIPAINPTLASLFSESVKKSEEEISTTDAKGEGKKRKWKNTVIPGFVKANIINGLPDLNGNATENESSKVQTPATENSSSSVFKTFKKMDFSSLQNFLAINSEVKLELNQTHMAGNIEQTEPQLKKMKMKNKASEENPNSLNPNPAKKQRKNKKSEVNLTYKKLVEEDESIGSALLLKFDQEQPPLPTKEALLAAFSGFGNLKESETDVFLESHTAQVVFLNSSEAGNAFRSMEKTGPFGPSLVTFRLIHISEPPPEMKYIRPTPPPLPATTTTTPSPSLPIPAIASAKGLASARRAAVLARKTPQQQMQQQQQQQQNGNLMKMRSNLEMMTRVLEKTGSNLAPDLRLKLENDINGLLTKLRRMDGTTNTK